MSTAISWIIVAKQIFSLFHSFCNVSNLVTIYGLNSFNGNDLMQSFSSGGEPVMALVLLLEVNYIEEEGSSKYP